MTQPEFGIVMEASPGCMAGESVQPENQCLQSLRNEDFEAVLAF